MASYYVNDRAQPNGDHEVHVSTCQYLPHSKTYLGEHSTCHSAVLKAKQFHRQSNGCYFCSNQCHTQ